MLDIWCLFENTLPLPCKNVELLIALQAYLDQHFGRAWGFSARVIQGDKGPLPPGHVLHFLDNSDQAGALGYHDDPAGVPRGFVFLADAAKAGMHVATVASHELVELLADPWCNLTVRSPRGRFVAFELADPVQSSSFPVNGLPMSNFVLPAWFGEGPGPFDQMHVLSSAWQIGPGGYALTLNPFTGRWDALHGFLPANVKTHAFARPTRRK